LETSGYGTIMLAVVIWLRLKFKENELIQVATAIIGPAATMVIAFGMAYGELFGDCRTERAGSIGDGFGVPLWEMVRMPGSGSCRPSTAWKPRSCRS
jgi:vacuolar-type H+-ATPase subunit I/STV1